MSYGREYCRKIDSVKDKLNAVLKEVGLEITAARYTYGEQLFAKFELSDPNNTVAVATKSADIKFFCQRNGLPENIIGTKFHHGRSMYEVVGIDVNKPKRCMKLKRSDGKPFISDVQFVKAAMAA